MRGAVALVLGFALVGCRTPGAAERARIAEVSTMELVFAEGRGNLTFSVEHPALVEQSEVHWDLRLDGRPIGSGVGLAIPHDHVLTLNAPLPLKGLRFEEGARRVKVTLNGDAEKPGEMFATPLSFSYERELLISGAPLFNAGDLPGR